MRVLVATTEGQGAQAGDYCWTLDGELVLIGPMLECCDADRCGCTRGFPGLGSARATTTAMVVERPELGRDELRRAIHDGLDRQGWLSGLAGSEAELVVNEEVMLIQRVVAALPVGSIVARDGDTVWLRRNAA